MLVHEEVAFRVMKLFCAEVYDVDVIADFSPGMRAIDESGAGEKSGYGEGVAHGWNQNDQSNYNQMPGAGAGDQPDNTRPEWLAIHFKVIKKTAGICKIKRFHKLLKYL